MIEVSGITKTYGAIKALTDVTFSVPKGQIVGFLGANGAGKTTTMDILCGCIGPDVGVAKICGYDITDQPIDAKRKLGYLPDQAPIHLDMRVEDYISYSAKLHKIANNAIATRVDETLNQLSLTDVRHRVIGNLSKGYRQRVALAQALVHDPDVLVLDEPTEGLDPTQIAHIRELIRKLGGKHTVILSSHILSEVQNTCDYLIIIHKGKIVQQGTYEQLSATLEGGRVYRLRVGKNVESAKSLISSIPGLGQIKLTHPETFELEFVLAKSTDDQALDDVAKKVVDSGLGLRELALKTKSLEEVFFQVTTK